MLIFKKGDDLRKDILVLQMFRTMDAVWKSQGLDLHMHPYAVVATGFESGIIEVVTRSITTGAIHKLAGGAAGAFKDSAVADWLRTMNPTEEAFEQARANFTRSCAGYCVATYVLGIGDRHNDNIMVSEIGNLFHIDFAHVMGDYLKFGVFDRETAPFVLTPEFLYMIGGENSENFQYFKLLCSRAYNILRAHSDLFLSLFSMMLGTGIPGLDQPEDIHYLRDAFTLDMDDTQASKHFEKL
eukprot:CAMPEP_0201562830 /NCGR_PEP_ID=MMETSP0173_2-20130828/79542_1 /ASSEMBLY_ACC=CAM_ASM_000268 /TAXON_ID=218659 /ORGANISM="Vexillifera sp., Strain DIVA3 564/2" /LENGTH=240 /DNA_ID=CAMNT_0047977435 /DNA_START=696 /DNA_END=1415 /DNA_ORIENTATION=-